MNEEKTQTFTQNGYNPDVLSCLANLSNDEVFTPPEIANKMLDMLPQEIFSDPDATFLDPACKSGVFLREIAKRLIVGLEPKIPNLQERIDHIFHKQLYGIAITELTALLTRRSLYCSKYADSDFSVSKFDTPEGNIRFKRIEHKWLNGRCVFCGASQDQYSRGTDLETHAYEWIHTNNPEEIFGMKFDVIIGNPPYQMSDGGAQASARPIYQLFVKQSKNMKPRLLEMITPARWYSGGRGLDEYRAEMLNDKRLTKINDFPNASECFPGVEIKGGVCYFVWDLYAEEGNCLINTYKDGEIESHANRPLLEPGCDVFIRNNNLVSIFKKVSSFKEQSFKEIVSPLKPYGLRGDFFKNPAKYNLPSVRDEKRNDSDVTIYGLGNNLRRTTKFVDIDYPLPKRPVIEKFKMFMARNQGSGLFGESLSEPIFARKNEICTETFIYIGGFDTEDEMMNCYSYMQTKFFRALLSVRKNDQNAAQGVYTYIPLQDFSKPWCDEELYKKYNLSEQEIKFIEENVK